MPALRQRGEAVRLLCACCEQLLLARPVEQTGEAAYCSLHCASCGPESRLKLQLSSRRCCCRATNRPPQEGDCGSRGAPRRNACTGQCAYHQHKRQCGADTYIKVSSARSCLDCLDCELAPAAAVHLHTSTAAGTSWSGHP